jgi:cell division transport system ATP-binding protein
MIIFSNVTKTYKKNTPIFQDLSLTINEGEFVVITGNPGAGKTTLLKMILNEEAPTKGDVLFEGSRIHKFSGGNMKKFRRSVGAIFQDYKLLPYKTAFENVAFALEVQGADNAEIFKDTVEVLDIVGILHRKDHFPHELSGGEKQKVAISRALINRPKIILADEPTGSLDENTAKEIIQILKAIHSLGTTIVMTTHNDKLLNTVKGVRKLNIKQGGVIHEPLKGLTYGTIISVKDITPNKEEKKAELEDVMGETIDEGFFVSEKV